MKRIIFVGAGRQTQKDHIPAAMKHPECEIVGIVEPNAATLQQACETVGCPGFTDLDTALKFCEPTAAIVSVPHVQYFPVLEKLAENRIATLKEKPLAINSEEGSQVVELYKKNNTYLQICVQRRFSHLYDTCSKLIKNIGSIFSLYAEYTLSLESLDKSKLGWRANKAVSGGGASLDLGYHTIDLLTYLFGMPDKIYAQLNFNSLPGDYSIDDSMKALCTYRNGQINAHMFVTKIYRRKGERIRIFGDQGYVTIDDRTVKLYNRQHELLESHSFNTKEQEVIDQFSRFLKNSSGGIDVKKDRLLQDQLLNMKIIDAIYESNSKSKIVRFNNG